MPIPAGTGIDRRRFLLGAAGGLVAVYGAGRLGLGGQAFSEGIAQAAETQSAPESDPGLDLPGRRDRRAVGTRAGAGPDHTPSCARRWRISASESTLFTEDPALAWGPAAAPFAQLHDAGKMIVMPGSGYADEDMSHFTSRHYWEVGALDTSVTTGWLGRYLDQVGSSTNPLQGLSMDSAMNPTLATTRVPVAAIDRPENFSLWIPGTWGPVFEEALDAAARLGDVQRSAADAAISQVASAASEVGTVRRALQPFANVRRHRGVHEPGDLSDSSRAATSLSAWPAWPR